MQKPLFTALFLVAALRLLAGDFTLETRGFDTRIQYRGAPFIQSVVTRVLPKAAFAPDAKSSAATLPNGAHVFNIWSDNRASEFRQEVALAPDGNSVEITFGCFNDADNRSLGKSLEITLPYALFEGADYEGLDTNGRMFSKVAGKFTAATPNGNLTKKPLRFLAVKKGGLRLVFDFMPLGPGDYINCWQQSGIRGIWEVVRDQDRLVLRQKTSLKPTGGVFGSKIRILPGVFADYGRLHALREFQYAGGLPAQRQFSFGAQKTGKSYTHADLAPFDAAKGYGWRDATDIAASIQSPEGAYYSHVAGRDRTFRIAGLGPGIHLVTVGVGNFNGTPNSFRVLLNGKPMTDAPVSAATREALVLTRAVWIENGTLDLAFEGDFLLSTVATQFLLATAEDFSLRRTFWVSKGYEPMPTFCDADWTPPAPFPCAMHRLHLPVPGQETATPLRMPERLVELPPADAPQTAWRDNANLMGLTAGVSALTEWRDPAVLDRALAKLKEDGVCAVMPGGIFSHHTYPARTVERGNQMHAIVNAAAHRHGIKILEHHDATLLWNINAGFRALCERVGELEADRETGLPNWRFCILNPQFQRAYFDYAGTLARLGADGFQVDEASFFARGCLCAECRRRFHAETGWFLPMNELDPRLSDRFSPLYKAWFQWKKINEGNWFVEMRRALKPVNPHLVFSMYSTHWGFIRCLPSNNVSTDLEELARAINFFGTEVMTRNPLASARALVPFRKAFNLFRFSYGAPVWGIFYNNAHEARYFGYALSNMNGQQALLVHTPPPPGASDFQAFNSHPDNMDRRTAREVAEVALLYSRNSRDWNSGVSNIDALFGLAQTLEEMHVPYLIVGENALAPETLRQFKVLSIGSSACLDDRQLDAIFQFVRDGGTLLCSDIAASCNELGIRRPVWPLQQFLGFQLRPRAEKGIPKLIASDGRVLPLKAPAICFAPKPLTNAPCAWYAALGDKIRIPVYFERKVGKGRLFYQTTRLTAAMYAMEGGVGGKWGFERDDALADLLHAELGRILADARVWETDAPRKVYATIYNEPRRTLVHFLNATGADWLKKGEVMTDVIPASVFPPIAKDIRFTLRQPARPVSQVYAVSPDFQGRKPLQWKQEANGAVSAVLPAGLLKVYTIVCLE